ncbi:MAG TPA: low affinity iron permease family protein [Devosia sp.]
MSASRLFSDFSNAIARGSGRPITFVAAVLLIVVWAISGPIFGFSETWQLVINTATTIVTFLMVFVLQNTQNRDGEALHAKLDELILVSNAENRFIEAERLTEDEIRRLRRIIEKAVDEDPDTPPSAHAIRNVAAR